MGGIHGFICKNHGLLDIGGLVRLRPEMSQILLINLSAVARIYYNRDLQYAITLAGAATNVTIVFFISLRFFHIWEYNNFSVTA